MNESMLYDLDIEEVSVVDDPANQHAAVVLFKRVASESVSGYEKRVKPEDEGFGDEGDGSVTVEELTRKLEVLQSQVADLTRRATEAEAANAVLLKSVKDAGLDIEDGRIVKRAEPEYVEIDGERVEKALVPAPVLRAIEKQAAEIARMKAKAEEVELAKRGETELPNLAGTALAKGRLLAAVEADAELLKALKAADAAMKRNYEEVGSANPDDEASPAYRLDQLAKAYAAANRVSFETAYAAVTRSGEGVEILTQLRREASKGE